MPIVHADRPRLARHKARTSLEDLLLAKVQQPRRQDAFLEDPRPLIPFSSRYIVIIDIVKVVRVKGKGHLGVQIEWAGDRTWKDFLRIPICEAPTPTI